MGAPSRRRTRCTRALSPRTKTRCPLAQALGIGVARRGPDQPGGDVAMLVDDALEARALEVPREGSSWQRFVRLALFATAEAHGIDAQRETGDYSERWPTHCGIPLEQLTASAQRRQPGTAHGLPRSSKLVPQARPQPRRRLSRPPTASSWRGSPPGPRRCGRRPTRCSSGSQARLRSLKGDHKRRGGRLIRLARPCQETVPCFVCRPASPRSS